MAKAKKTRLNKVLKEFNISLDRAVQFLDSQGIEVDRRPTTKIEPETYEVLAEEFQTDKSKKAESKEVGEERRKEQEELREEREKAKAEKEKEKEEVIKAKSKLSGPKQVGSIDLDKDKKAEKEPEKEEDASAKEAEAEPQKTSEEPKAESEEKTPETTKASEEPAKEQPQEEDEKDDGEPKTVSNRPGKRSTTVKGKIDLDKKSSDKATEEKTEEKKSADKKSEEKEETAKPAAEKTTEKPTEETAEKPDKPSETTETEEEKKTSEEEKSESDKEGKDDDNKVKTEYQKLEGLKVTGKKIDLSQFEKRKKQSKKRRKRKRISKKGGKRKSGNKKGRKNFVKEEPTEEEIQKQVRETLEKLQGKGSKSKAAKYRREKRDTHKKQTEEEQKEAEESKVLKVTEFVPVNDLAAMMSVPVTKVIGACMSLGIMVTMNQRLDAETLSIVAEEFGYDVEFVDAEIEEDTEIVETEEDPEKMVDRAPIITVMGHVDHGKTSLLDYIRETNVIAGESGGITQHIGAYSVTLQDGKQVTFLDTPGHEAFTAMRARGTQVTDLAIIVIAADDDVMPQTKEAISHAQAAGVPIVFAINKIDRDVSNPEKIKESLANENLLVEDWGGKVQSQDISAKTGQGVDDLMEKVLLEAELLELKANPDTTATGTVVEAYLDKGRGYVSTILVQSGTLRMGDYLLAGKHHGKIKAMQDERGHSVKEAGPATPVSVLGLDGAPQAGDKFNVFTDEGEAKELAAKRTQLQREQTVRTQKHVTLDELGRRIALGEFQELNLIIKGDVDGSVEALTDSFQKLSTEEIEVNVKLKGVGAITESDVLLASASDAIIIGFNVRPQGSAKRVAEKEGIDIRTYSIIYDAINDVKDAMEGMLSPELKEEITGNAEVRETFKISRIGTIAGCMITDGKVYRNCGVRVIRDGVVKHTGELATLKRYKDDVKEVAKGYECGMQIKGFNDIKEEDIIECYREVEVKKTL